MNTSTTDAIPFLKWAGGKRWFADRFRTLAPRKFNRYLEPFLGSGALFFAIRPADSILSDINADLIRTYEAVRDQPTLISAILAKHQEAHSKPHYYWTRSNKPEDPAELAAWLIYLNRTCWNGLYRVNRKNEFNVPIGTKTSVQLPTDDFVSVSALLKGASLVNCDFEETIDKADKDDFVFVDPPYTVKHNQNGFLKYNDQIFSWEDQVRLKNSVLRAARRGAKVLVTNANHRSVRELYKEVGQLRVLGRTSVLAANSAHRAKTEELVVRTWLAGR